MNARHELRLWRRTKVGAPVRSHVGLSIGGQLLSLFCAVVLAQGVTAQENPATPDELVQIESQAWRLVGDLQRPTSPGPYPAVLLLNQAAGNRAPYAELASHLASLGIASLRLDLRGHGESTNLGRFVPGESPRDPMIWDAEADVVSAYRYLATLEAVDSAQIGVVGASYSGEEAIEAGRSIGYAALYVLLSPGSLSDVSIASMARSERPWLFAASQDDPFTQGITEAVRSATPSTEMLLLPGESHGTDLLRDHETLAASIAEWIARHLNP